MKNFKKQIQNEIPENVVFVGVHYRGSDFVNYLKKRSGQGVLRQIIHTQIVSEAQNDLKVFL